ncbi:MAG: ABC transporter permease [Oscillospiraceae bacterium]|nr:ABC transporter permease [Oscillospiraceae bacterium]
MALFVVAPLVIVLFYALTTEAGGFGLENFIKLQVYVPVFLRSLWLAFIATVLCLLIGYPAAYILSRETPSVQNSAILLMMLPMWMNFLLRTYAWMSILEDQGLINNLLRSLRLPALNMINTQGAVVLGMVYNYLPFMILPIFTIIQKIPPSMTEAAQDLGANSRRVFRRVVFPLSLPGVLSGVTMVFVPSVSTFVISKLLGGGKQLLLGDLIEMQFLGGAYNLHLGSMISIVMMLIVLAGIQIMNRFGSREEVALP